MNSSKSSVWWRMVPWGVIQSAFRARALCGINICSTSVETICIQHMAVARAHTMVEMTLRAHTLNSSSLRRRRMVLQSLRGFSFSVSPRLLQLELCFCSSQHTHTPSLSNLSWGGRGENTHPHSCMHATYTITNTHTCIHTHKHTHKDTCTDQTRAWCSDVFYL